MMVEEFKKRSFLRKILWMNVTTNETEDRYLN